MSIINDALKKVQKNMENPSTPQPSTPETPKSSFYPVGKNTANKDAGKKISSQKTETKPPKTAQLLLTLVIVFIIFVVYQIQTQPDWLKDFNRSGGFSSLLKKAAPAPSKPKPAPVEVYAPGTIVVKGTMNSGDKWVALINGKIYEAGESIEGKTITAITLAGIEIIENNSKRFISVQGK